MDWMLLWQAIGAGATVVAAFLAFRALSQANKIFSEQQRLTAMIHQQQMKLSQRQLFVPIFDQLKNLKDIDPRDPVWPDVVYAVNFLELLGICWEGQLVDDDILFRVFRKIVIETYDNIKQCKIPEGTTVRKDGTTLLRESLAATSLYEHLVKNELERNRPSPIQ